MSDSSIGLNPLIEEPSKPMPPSKASSSSAALIEKLFSWPSRSVNQSRTKRTSFCSQNASTSFAVVVRLGHEGGNLPPSHIRGPPIVVSTGRNGDEACILTTRK